MAYSHTSVDRITVYGKMIANLQKDASVQTLDFYNASSGHQFKKKEKLPKSAEYYSCLRRKTDLHFFRDMANLS